MATKKIGFNFGMQLVLNFTDLQLQRAYVRMLEAHVDQILEVPVQIAGFFVGPDQLGRLRSCPDAVDDLVDLSDAPMATLAPRLAS